MSYAQNSVVLQVPESSRLSIRPSTWLWCLSRGRGQVQVQTQNQASDTVLYYSTDFVLSYEMSKLKVEKNHQNMQMCHFMWPAKIHTAIIFQDYLPLQLNSDGVCFLYVDGIGPQLILYHTSQHPTVKCHNKLLIALTLQSKNKQNDPYSDW